MNTTKIIALGVLTLSVAGCGFNNTPIVTTQNPTSTSTDKSVEVVDTRSVWTFDQFERSLDFTECDNLPVLNTDTPNTEVAYKNKQFGIEMAVPYNEAWGTKDYKIEVADLITTAPTGDFIGFGPLTLISGKGHCSYARDYQVQIMPQRGKGEVLTALKADKTIGSDRDVLSFKEEIIGDKQTMVYNVKSPCEQFHYEVKGPKNNYVFSTFCSDNVDDSAYLRGVIQSLKFI